MNKNLGIIVGAGIFLFAMQKMMAMVALVKNVSVSVVKIYAVKINKLNVRFKIDLEIINPASISLSLKLPYVVIYFDNEALGSSVLQNKKVRINKNGITEVKGVLVDIPVTNARLMLEVFKYATNINELYKHLSMDMTLNISGFDISKRVPFE